MARLGADPEQLDEVARRLHAVDSLLDRTRSNLSARLRSTYWEGPYAQDYRNWWARTGAPHLSETGSYMSSVGRYLHDEASNQRWASQGVPTNASWPRRPIAWVDPVPTDSRVGPSGQGSFGSNGSGDQSDPVDSATGAFWFREVDLEVRTASGLALPLKRYHHSWLENDLSFGPGFTSIFDLRLYQADGGLVGIQTDEGQFLEFRSSDDDGYVTPAGVDSTLERAAQGWILTDLEGRRISFDSAGRLASLGRVGDLGFRFQHDDEGRIVEVTNVADGPVTVEYNANRIAAIHHSWGDLDFTYDSDRLVSVESGNGTSRYVWDQNGRIAEQYDSRGRLVVANTYGENGRVAEQRDGLGGLWTLDWDEGSTSSTMTDPAGGQWTDRYVDGLLVERTNAVGGGVRIERDGIKPSRYLSMDGEELSASPSGPASTAQTSDLLTQLAAQNGIQLERNPDVPGQILSSTENGTRVDYSYDETGRIVEVTTPDGAMSFEYEKSELSAVRANIDGEDLAFWIEDGDLWRSTGADGTSKVAEGDEHGRVTGLFDPAGRRTEFTFDDWDRLTGVTATDGSQTQYELDPFGRLAKRTDAVGRELIVERDAAQRLQAFSSEDGAVYRFQLDPMNRMVEQYDGANRSLQVERGLDGEVRSITGNLVDVEVDYTVDEKVAAVNGGGHATEVEYDEAGNVVGFTHDGRTVRYEFGDNGSVVGKTIDGVAISIGYLGALEAQITGPAGSTDVVKTDGEDELTLVLPNGVRSRARWDNTRLEELEVAGPDGPILHERYSTDLAGNLSGVDGIDHTWSYQYDDRDMLVSADRSGDSPTSMNWRYNAVGTRLSETIDGEAVESSLDDRSRPVEITADGELRQVEYDGAGFVTRDGDWSYTYDARGALRVADDGERRVEYEIDGFGNRVRSVTLQQGEIVKDVSTVWDLSVEPAQPVLAIDNLTGDRELYHHDGVGAPLAVVPLHDPSQVRWFVTDHLGSVRVVTDASGAVVGRRDYAPFGEVLSTTDECDTGLLNFGFTGAITDADTSLVHLRAREYNPELGRFLAPDPVITPPGEAHVTGYAYAFNRPTVLVDPTGLWPGFIDRGIAAATSFGRAAIDCLQAGVDPSFLNQVIDRVRDFASAIERGAKAAADWIYENRTTISNWLNHIAVIGAVVGVVAVILTAGGALPFVLGFFKMLSAGSAAFYGTIALLAIQRGETDVAIEYGVKAGLSLASFGLAMFGGHASGVVSARLEGASLVVHAIEVLDHQFHFLDFLGSEFQNYYPTTSPKAATF